MAIGELVTRLTCDSSNFDNNIRRSQREVQEFRRRTEQSAARINNAFNRMGSVASNVSPRIGSLIGALGGIAPAATAAGAAYKIFTEAVKHNEDLMDSWEKKTIQVNGVLDSFYIRLSQPDGFYRFKQNLKETINLLGDYADAQDNVGTFKGFSNISNSKVRTAIAEYKEAKRNPESTPEQIAAKKKAAKDAIEEADKVTKVVLQSLKDEFKSKVGIIFKGGVGNNAISNKEAFGVISRFSKDIDTYNDIKSAASLLKGKSEKELLYSPYFKRLLKELGIKREGLFNPAMFKYNIATIGNLRDFIVNLSKLVEQGNLTELQKIVTEINDQEYLLSTQKNAYFKQLEDPVDSNGGGGSVYTSKQEAPKERTLQDILDDLDKSLAWNKYQAQNLGKNVNELNTSTLERTVNELTDLLKNTTDEKDKSEIINVIKSLNDRAGIIAVNSTKSLDKQDKDEKDYINSYDVKSAFYDTSAIQAEGIIYTLENKINYDKRFKPLLKSMIEKFKERGLTINFDVESLSDEKLLKASNWDYKKFFKDNVSYSIDTSVNRERMSEEEKLKELNIELGKFRDVIQEVIAIAQLSYNLRKGNIRNMLSRSVFTGGDTYLDSKLLAESNNFGGLDSPVFGGSVLSSTYLSNVDTIGRKYTGFSKFQSDFKKYAFFNFLKSRTDPDFDTSNILPLIYDAYSKALSDNPAAPKFYKSVEDIMKDNPLYDEQHPHKELKEKVEKILNKKNVSLLALDELKNIDKGDISNKIRSGYLDLYKEDKLSDIFNDAEISSPFNRAELIKLLLLKLNSLRENRVKAYQNIDDEVNIDQETSNLNNYKKIQEALVLLIKEKKKEITEEELKKLNELRNDSGVGGKIKGYGSQSEDAINDTITEYGNKIQETNKKIDNANKTKEKITDEINKIDKAVDNTIDAQRSNDELVERAKQYKELTNNMYAISNAAAQIGTAFSSLDSELGDVAGSIFNIIGITAEAIGKILGMATAEGTLSAMKLPWPKNLVAVATVVAAGASIAGQVKGMTSRKYATGGIVSGPGTGISDSIPIRVSNGEMILNHRQQSNLFNLLDKGSSTEGKIEFKNKLVGSDIIGSATTYNKRRNLIL